MSEHFRLRLSLSWSPRCFLILLWLSWSLPGESRSTAWSFLSRRGPVYRQRLRNYHNVQYVAEIKLGDQPVAGLYDTGSPDIVVKSDMCDGCVLPQQPYDHKKSSTYAMSGIIHKITYGAGSCEVCRGFEKITVGPMQAPHQEFWEVMEHSIPIWNTAAYEAVIGLGPTEGTGYDGGGTLLMSLGVEVFSMCLQRANASDGFLTFGEQNTGVVSAYPPAKVLGNQHWETRLGRITLSNGAPVNLCPDSSCVATIDSGHSLIEGPMDQIMALSDHINVKEDCSNIHELPTLRFELDGQLLELPPNAYVVRLGGAPKEAERVWPILPTGGAGKPIRPNTCHVAFMIGGAVSDFGPNWVFGMPFFRYFHTTFNRVERTMRFARAGPDCEPLPAGKQLALTAGHAETSSLLDIDLGAIITGSSKPVKK